jgi:PAS domain S-box-containing protein
MKQTELPNLLIEQSNDSIWIIDASLKLVYANKTYQRNVVKATGVEPKLNESAFIKGFSKAYVDKWRAYYKRCLLGEHFEIEEHYTPPKSKEIFFSQIIFKPLFGDNNEVIAVSCLSRDITRIVKERSETNQLMDASVDVFCTINEQGYFLYVSAAASKNWGYSPEELINTPYLNLLLEEDVEKTLETQTAVFNGEISNSFVNRYKKKNGGIAYNIWSVNWDKNTRLMYCVARDGKEQIEREEKIQRSEQYFKALVQEGSDLIGILDEEGNYIYVSPTSFSVLGIAPENFIGRNALEFIHPDDVEKTLVSLRKISNEKKVIVEPFRFQNAKKEWRWMETVLTNMTDNPAVNGIVANSRDITEKINKEHELKLLESVIVNTKDAVLITEAEPFDQPGTKIIYVNDAFTKMTGYSSEEVIGKSPRMFQGPNSNRAELEKMGQAMRNWEPYELTTLNYKKNGEEFWINFTVTPVANEKGWYTHWIAIERDVTEKKIKEIENDLVNKIVDIFNETEDNDLKECLSKLCKQITTFGDFDFAEIWLPSSDENSLLRLSFYASSKAGSAFYRATRNNKSYAFGEGISGYVWKSKTTEIWGIDEGKWIDTRQAAAEIAGINTAVGIPLKYKDEVIGVLLLGSVKAKTNLTLFCNVFQNLESIIGAELSRKKIEIELAQIFDFSPDIICVAGFDGYLKRINPAGLEILGYTLEEMLSRPIKSFIHEDDRELTIEKQKGLYERENLGNFENRYITKQGKIVWLSWTATSAPGQGIVYAVAKNITEEKNLRELNRQAGILAKIGSWELDLVNQRLFWSDEVHLIHETDPKIFAPILETSINFYREDFRQLVNSSLEKSISLNEVFDFEAVLITAKKKEIWVRATGRPEFIDGECKRIYGSFQDIHDRKEAEIRLHSLANNLPGVVYQYLIYPDGTKRFKYVTKGSEQIWGFSAEEVLLNNELVWDRIAAGGDLEKIIASISNSIELKNRWEIRFKYVMPSGEVRMYLGTGTPIFLADGTVLINSIILDITQEVKNEELLKQITKIARIGSWEMDLANQVGDNMYWSPMLFDIVELDDSYDPTLTGGIEFHIGESKERLQNALQLLIKEGVGFDEELLLLTAKGNERWTRAIGKSEIVNNKRMKIYGSYQDIDERKKSEIKLAESENRFRTILKAEPECIKLLGRGGEVIMMNPAGLAMLDADNEEQVLGKSVQGLILAEHQMAFAKLTKNVFKGESGKLVFEISGFKGNRRWLETHAVPMKNEQGEITSLLGITRDISQEVKNEELLKQYTNELERSNLELEQFAFVASHDLQEPLRMVSSFMEQLKRKYGDVLDEKALRYIEFATDGASRMKQIILDLLEYSKAGKLNEELVTFNLNDTIEDYKILRRKIIGEKKVHIKNDNLPLIKSFKTPITQALHCLLDNAIKYSKAGVEPKIEIRISEQEEEWIVSVEDNGIGIEKEFFEKIFVIFQRLHNKDEFKGNGIGLSIAQKNIEACGGRLWLESVVNEGSTFYFSLKKYEI